jgi:hypothetical protein
MVAGWAMVSGTIKTTFKSSIMEDASMDSIDEEKVISPEWLESKGFIRYIPEQNYDHLDHFPPACFDVEFAEDDLCYIEKELDRKQFCIVLSPCEYTDGEKYYRFEIYIQEDIGCGFVNIPNQFTEMTEHHFSLLYEAIRREKL